MKKYIKTCTLNILIGIAGRCILPNSEKDVYFRFVEEESRIKHKMTTGNIKGISGKLLIDFDGRKVVTFTL